MIQVLNFYVIYVSLRKELYYLSFKVIKIDLNGKSFIRKA